MPPMIVYRTDGPWGTGKGANLTKEELDNNWWELVQEFANIVLQAPTNILNITVTDGQMTILMEDYSTFGPFTLPVANLTNRGTWANGTLFNRNDLFTVAEGDDEDGLYFVNKAHTAEAPFNPAAGDEQGPFAVKLIGYQTTFDIGFFYPAQPGYGIGDEYTADIEQPMFGMIAARPFYLPQDLPGALAKLDVAPTSALEFRILQNGVDIGTLNFSATDPDGTFFFPAPIEFVAGDLLQFYRPEVIDDTAYNLYVTLTARYGSIAS